MRPMANTDEGRAQENTRECSLFLCRAICCDTLPYSSTSSRLEYLQRI